MPTINFKGKTFVQNHHLAVKHHQLIPQPDKSLTDKVSLHDNLIIHGDNLIALKALLPTYAGKIKCIYIDPPYNTGNEGWVYNDNVKSPMIQEWLGKAVDLDDLTRHDKWLSMMLPRLKLLRELLSEDGSIFVSIDDNEQHRLRLLMDEIFGEENRIEQFIWKKSYGGGAKERFAITVHEYVLLYAKNFEFADEIWLPPDPDSAERYYKFTDSKVEERGPFRIKPLEATKSMDSRENLVYGIPGPDGNEILPKRQWWWSKKRAFEALENDELVFTKSKDGGWSISYKQYLFGEDGKQRLAKPFSIIDGIYTQKGTADLSSIFDGDLPLQFPKPVELIKQLIQMECKLDSNAIILDSFAGSGTTAEAVLDLNKEDGGNRKFILIEQEDYADSITAERVRRVIARNAANEARKGEVEKQKSPLLASQKIDGVESSKPTFSFFMVGEPIEMESILHGDGLPSFTEFARYLFYTATGEEFVEDAVDRKTGYIGESSNYEVYLFYKPDLAWLKSNALTLTAIRELPKGKGKRRLVFAPAKYVSDEDCRENKVDFSQLPFEIYRLEK